MHEGRGVVAKLLVQNGTLRVGDVVVCGAAYGRVKAMYDTLDLRADVRGGRPLHAGERDRPGRAPRGRRPLLRARRHLPGPADLPSSARPTPAQRDLAGSATARHAGEPLRAARANESEVQTLNIILRADVRGSIEAIRKELAKLEHPEVQIKVLQATVGGITEADVHLADASDAVIIGFNVVPDEEARALADEMRRADPPLRHHLPGDRRPARRPGRHAQAGEAGDGTGPRRWCKQVFHISRVGTVAGCRVRPRRDRSATAASASIRESRDRSATTPSNR